MSTPEVSTEGMVSGWRFVLILVLIAIDAFFVAAEFAVVSMRRSRVQQWAGAGDPAARSIDYLQRHLDRLLATTQLGITLSSLAMGWIGESVLAEPIAQTMANLIPGAGATGFHRVLAAIVAFSTVAYLQIVLGELCPKSIALLHPEAVARLLGPPSVAVVRFLHPIAWVLNSSTRALLGSLGVRHSGQGWYGRVTSEELQAIVASEGESSGLGAEARQLLENVFEFGQVETQEIMIPRPNIVWIPRTATVADLLRQVATTGHSRFPVADESLDDICGIADVKDLAAPLSEGQLELDVAIEPWLRPAKFVPESMALRELLGLMQQDHLPMAVVVDEFGNTAGLVTREDVVAEIVGTSQAELASKDAEIELLDDRTFSIQAQLTVEEVNDRLGLDLPLASGYQTLAGFLLYKWQKIPAVGEVLTFRDLEFTVLAANWLRVDRVRVCRLGDPAPAHPDRPIDEP